MTPNAALSAKVVLDCIKAHKHEFGVDAGCSLGRLDKSYHR